MGKYDKYLPKLTEKQKIEIFHQLSRRTTEITYARERDNHPEAVDSKYDYSDLQAVWEEKKVSILDVVRFGQFSAREVLKHIGVIVRDERSTHNLHLVEALSERFGGAMVLDYDENGKTFINTSYNNEPEAENSTRNLVHQQLTKWDKFWGFFGIKTDHAKDVDAHNAVVDSTKSVMEEYDTKLFETENKKALAQYLIQTENYESQKNLCINANNEKAKWQKAFFGSDVPPHYTLSNGREIPSIAICIAIYNKNTNGGAGKLDIDNITDTNRKNIADAVEEYRSTMKKRVRTLKEGATDYLTPDKTIMQQFDGPFFAELLKVPLDVPKTDNVTASFAVAAYPILNTKSYLQSNFKSLDEEKYPALDSSKNLTAASDIIKNASLATDTFEKIQSGLYKEALESYNKNPLNRNNPAGSYKELLEGAKKSLESSISLYRVEIERDVEDEI